MDVNNSNATIGSLGWAKHHLTIFFRLKMTKIVVLLSKTERSWNGSYPTCFGLSPSPSLLSLLLLETSWFFGLFVVGQKSCSSDLSDV